MSNAYGSTHFRESYNKEHQQNLKYKRKCKKIKKLIKNIVIENAALCDQVAEMQNNLVTVKEERIMLLKKLCQLQGETDPPAFAAKSQMGSSSSSAPNPDTPPPKKVSVKKRTTVETQEIKSKIKKSGKSARKVVQLIPLDVNGRPIFPITLGDLTVYSLGDIVTDRPGYHTEDLIFPVGYCSTRVYASLKDARMKSLYTCKILDGGVRPRFEIVSDTELDKPLVGASPDECHSCLMKAISPSLSLIPPKGADFFGISQPTIQNLIQSSPGTRKLSMYKPQKFEITKTPFDKDPSYVTEEENNPGLGFAALHKHYSLPYSHNVKQEPTGHDLISFQELLS
ncbi:hypothetical protein QAD02_016015 [Eretmocerus hayati]|uniref:Uncharacterized protein n=1 Tax=Eretmocerus hayati TaxID=131215 RepID=A0ACC2P9V9_9HYME|nr:hypothetical protein QAD02_016015 [Eretmocerus hayati]